MGKRLYKESDVSKPMTDVLGIDELLALRISTDSHFYAVHKRYFSEDKTPCPACGSTRTRCSKVIDRTVKDILRAKTSANEDAEQKFRIVDITFYQRYLRCDSCNNSVFPEPVDFVNKGCRYTNRLSDVLAEGAFRYSYKKVCDYYGVPASTASIGPIIRRRVKRRESELPPASTPKKLGIMETVFFRESYPIVFALRDEGVYCIDILKDSSEETVLTFLRTLDSNEVESVYIDPVDSIRSAALAAFPRAKLVVTDECILRYAKDAMIRIIYEDGKRFPIKFKDFILTIPDRYLLNEFQRKQIRIGLESRPRLKLAYEQHQMLMELMSGEWTYDDLSKWAHGLPDDLPEFETIVDVVDFFTQEISDYTELEEKQPEFYLSALEAICAAFKEMPYCTFDVLRARCFMAISCDTIKGNRGERRLGILSARFTNNMNKITENIREARGYGLQR